MKAERGLEIRPLREEDLPRLRQFTDREIGAGYYSSIELEDIFRRAQKNGRMCSFVIEETSPEMLAGEIQGVRLSFPPGQWTTGKGRGLHPDMWPHHLADTAYFQSLFLAAGLQGQGWGGRLSRHAIEVLRAVGAKGVVCHSWKESPNNSSARYLLKLGFQLVAEHPNYWQDVPYHCTRCGPPPCRCTAQEMYLNLETSARAPTVFPADSPPEETS